MVNGDTDATLRFHAASAISVQPGTTPSGEPNYVMGAAPEFEPTIWEEDWSIEPRAYKV